MEQKNKLIEAAVAFLHLPTSSTVINENTEAKSAYNKVSSQLKAGYTNSEGYEHEQVTMPANHHLIHHAEYGEEQRDQGEHRYSGKHPEGHSHTMIDTDTPTKSAMHREIRKQNPHLSTETHKALATAIHKDFHGSTTAINENASPFHHKSMIDFHKKEVASHNSAQKEATASAKEASNEEDYHQEAQHEESSDNHMKASYDHSQALKAHEAAHTAHLNKAPNASMLSKRANKLTNGAKKSTDHAEQYD